MSRIQNNEPEALAALYTQYLEYVRRYFMAAFFDRETSLDLAQVVFEKIIKYKHSYQGNSSLKTWIYSISRNVKIDYINKKNSEHNKISDYRRTLVAFGKENSPDKTDDLERLRCALAELSEDQKEIITLGKLENLKYKEIASLLNISESNVKIRIYRAMKALKRNYEQLDE